MLVPRLPKHDARDLTPREQYTPTLVSIGAVAVLLVVALITPVPRATGPASPAMPPAPVWTFEWRPPQTPYWHSIDRMCTHAPLPPPPLNSLACDPPVCVAEREIGIRCGRWRLRILTAPAGFPTRDSDWVGATTTYPGDGTAPEDFSMETNIIGEPMHPVERDGWCEAQYMGSARPRDPETIVPTGWRSWRSGLRDLGASAGIVPGCGRIR